MQVGLVATGSASPDAAGHAVALLSRISSSGRCSGAVVLQQLGRVDCRQYGQSLHRHNAGLDGRTSALRFSGFFPRLRTRAILTLHGQEVLLLRVIVRCLPFFFRSPRTSELRLEREGNVR